MSDLVLATEPPSKLQADARERERERERLLSRRTIESGSDRSHQGPRTEA
jgi:hypothetical protein